LAAWISSVTTGVSRPTAQISALRADGSLVACWGLIDVLAVSWQGPTLIRRPGRGHRVLEIAHQGFTDAGAGSVMAEKSKSGGSGVISGMADKVSAALGSLVRATLAIHEPPLGSGTTPGALIKTFKFDFNPTQLSLSRRTEWKTTPTAAVRDGAMPEFMGPEPRQMTVDVFLDESDERTTTM